MKAFVTLCFLWNLAFAFALAYNLRFNESYTESFYISDNNKYHPIIGRYTQEFSMGNKSDKSKLLSSI